MATFCFRAYQTLQFNHGVPVNKICVVMSCLEIDMGKSCSFVFCLSFQRVNLSTAHYFTNSTDRDEMIKACDALVACQPNLNVNIIENMQFITPSRIDQLFQVL